ncbi:cell division protein PerM, partial [Streptomyces sp. NPDC003514]
INPACSKCRSAGRARRLAQGPDAPARLAAAARAAGAGAAALVGGGALLVAVSLVWHGVDARQTFAGLTQGWSGRVGVLLLCASLVPNAAVWAASYALGPGFVLGAGHVVAPLTSAPPPPLPPFPLLDAVPSAGIVGPLQWAVAAVPVVAGVVLGRGAARWGSGGDPGVRGDTATGTGRTRGGRAHSGPQTRGGRNAPSPARPPATPTWSPLRTAAAALLASVICACLVAVLAGLSGGPLGRSALAEFGPVWWQAGAATLVWVALVGVPVAVVVRGWRCLAHATRRDAEPRAAAIGLPRTADTSTGARKRVPAGERKSPFTALVKDQPVPQQNDGRPGGSAPAARYDGDDAYEAAEEVPYGAYDHDTTFEPDGYQPDDLEPTGPTPKKQDPKEPDSKGSAKESTPDEDSANATDAPPANAKPTDAKPADATPTEADPAPGATNAPTPEATSDAAPDPRPDTAPTPETPPGPPHPGAAAS